jgi:predicted RNA binding protein YcfA (HicA-like mRNA interferase family)
MTPREVLHLLHKDGWRDESQAGGHLQLVHPSKKGKVTVPCHPGDIKPNTLRSIQAQSGVTMKRSKKK